MHVKQLVLATTAPDQAFDTVLQVADRLEAAVTAALDAGYRTGDLMSSGMKQVGCTELGDILVKQITEAKH